MTALSREQFPVAASYRYFDHAGIAPLSKPAADAIRWWVDRFERQGKIDYDDIEARLDATRVSAARLMGVPVDDVAFVKNTTEGIGFVASGLTWRTGDRVVVPDLEFPSTVYPWLALRDLGVRVDFVAPRGEPGALPVEAFGDVIAAGPPPKVVAASWVQYGRGWRTDLAGLAAVCHDAGALVCIDVIQGLGVVPVDLAACGVDFAMADGHKWLCGPEGQGVLYVAEPVRDRLRPLEPGWASVSHRTEWENLGLDWDPSARRFEGGTPNAAGIVALGASIDLLLAAGVEAVWAHVQSLGDRLCRGLERIDGVRVLSDRGAGRSAIVTFAVEGVAAEQVVDRLAAERFVCSPRAGGVRVSPHGYNDAGEIDALVDAVDTVARLSTRR